MPANRIRGQQKILLLLLTATLLLTACGADNPIEPINPAATATASPTRIVQPNTALPSTSSVLTVLPSITKTTPAISQDWQYHWLKGIPCRPPCWEGITPGQTTAEEAEKLLKQNPFVDSNSIKLNLPGPVPPPLATLTWKWRKENFIGTATYNAQNPNHVILDLSTSYTVKFRLGDIIQVYGEPSYVLANKAGDIPSISFHWLSQGFAIGTFKNQGEKPPTIDAQLLLGGSSGGPRFFVPTTPEKIAAETKTSSEAFVPWQGYKDFIFYCREGADYGPCSK